MLLKSHQIKRLASGILTLLLLVTVLLPGIPARAVKTRSETKVVRLGYVNVPGYEEGLEGEYKTGLGYEYFQHIAYLENWRYEYVYGSFATLLDMLAKGEIDVFGNVSFTPERAQLFDYSDYAMGKDIYHLAVLADNQELRQGDLSSYNHKKVGVTRGSFQEKLLLEWIEKNGLDMNVVEFEGSSDAFVALDHGEIDCVAYTRHINQPQYTSTFFIGSSDYYFAVSRERPDLLEELNDALYTIQTENPLFNDRLSAKYENDTLRDVTLSAAEQSWLQAHPDLTVGYIDNYLPFSTQNKDGSVGGALPVIMDTLREKLHLTQDMRLHYVPYASAEELCSALQTGEVHIAFPLLDDFYYSEQNEIMQSYSVVSSAIALIHQGDYNPSALKTLAVLKGNILMDIYSQVHYPDCRLVYCDSVGECFDAVENGEADGFLVTMSRAQYYLSMGNHTVTANICPYNANFVLGVRQGQAALLKILNRGISAIDSTYFHSILNEFTPQSNTATLKQFLRDNMILIILVVTLTVMFICARVAYNLQRMKHINNQLTQALENYKKADTDRRTDFLTGLRSRQDMFELLQDTLTGRYPPITAMYMLDIDNFKRLNDTFGHAYGDHCLKTIGQALRTYGEAHDIAFCRYGGEEMLGICFSAHRPAEQVARELVQLVRDQKLERNDAPSGVVTVSLGYTTVNNRYEKMINMADTAMYVAKEQGKDRAVCYETIC